MMVVIVIIIIIITPNQALSHIIYPLISDFTQFNVDT